MPGVSIHEDIACLVRDTLWYGFVVAYYWDASLGRGE